MKLSGPVGFVSWDTFLEMWTSSFATFNTYSLK